MTRPRKPAHLLALAGGFDKDRKRTRRDAEGVGQIGLWRPGSEELAAIWKEIISTAPSGLLTASDRVSVELAVHLVAQFRADPGAFPAGKLTVLMTLLRSLGMNPQARVQIGHSEPKDADDPAEKFFQR